MNEKPSLQEQMRKAAAEKMWLQYFNNHLLSQGVITPEEHRKIQVKLATRKGGSKAGR